MWNVRLLEKHGVKNYPLNDFSIDLMCEERTTENDEPIITAICDEPIEIEIHYASKTKIIHASPRD